MALRISGVAHVSQRCISINDFNHGSETADHTGLGALNKDLGDAILLFLMGFLVVGKVVSLESFPRLISANHCQSN